MHHETAIQWLGDRWLWVVFWVWLLGGFTWAGEKYRKIGKARRKAVAQRRTYRLELARARAGTSGQVADHPVPLSVGTPLPAAVIPSPPGVQPPAGIPGDCRHEKIVPVIDGDGELRNWICANWPRCDAVFDKSVAVYADDRSSD